jgi:hypothetical protein
MEEMCAFLVKAPFLLFLRDRMNQMISTSFAAAEATASGFFSLASAVLE